MIPQVVDHQFDRLRPQFLLVQRLNQAETLGLVQLSRYEV